MNCIPTTRFRIVFAFAGILMLSASSTARQLATACTAVHTPQMRWVNAHASRGSRPCITISMPRNWVDEAHALVIRPFSDCASMRRCPSMRVIGSTTTFVLAIVSLRGVVRLWYLLGGPASLDLRVDRAYRVRGHSGGSADRQRRADRVHAPLDRIAAHIGKASVEGRHRIPEVRLGAADAGMSRADRPIRSRVPLEDRAWREGLGALAPHRIEAPPLARALIVERFDELSRIEVRAARALVVDPVPVREHRPPLVIDIGNPVERQVVHDRRGDDVADGRTSGDVHDWT